MLLTKQQEFMLEVLRRLGCVRIEQLARLLRQKFAIPTQETAERITCAALSQLQHCQSSLRTEQDIAYFTGWEIEPDRLEAISVMMELVGDALFDFSAETPPVLLRFAVEQPKPTAFAVVKNSPGTLSPRFFPSEKIIILLREGERPSAFPIQNAQIFAVKQDSGTYRFLTRKTK